MIKTFLTDPGHWAIGHVFRGFDGCWYFCDSHDSSCGFWMTRLDFTGPENSRPTRTNVSERAVDRTYHRSRSAIDGPAADLSDRVPAVKAALQAAPWWPDGQIESYKAEW